MKTYKDCKTRREFEDFIFSAFVQFYNLKCNCDEGIEDNFRNASSHYSRCDYWKICHAISRALDWSEEYKKQRIVKLCQQIISNDKSEGYSYGEIRPSDEKIPEQGQRWLTPREFAKTWIKEELTDQSTINQDEVNGRASSQQ